MDHPTVYGPLPSEAIYTDISTAVAAIQGHAKCNGYALCKHDSRPSRVVYVCDQYGKPQAKPKNPDIRKSKIRGGSRSKKCNCRMKAVLKRDAISQHWQLEVTEGAQ